MKIIQTSLLALALTTAAPALAQNTSPTAPPASTRVETKDNDFEMGWIGLLGLLGLAGLMGRNRRHDTVTGVNTRTH
jgi:LPXTG-motif cell wall-anchored protein